MALDPSRTIAVEVATAGSAGFVIQHVKTEYETQPARNSHTCGSLALAFWIVCRSPFVIDADIVRANNLATTIHHCWHPIGRTIEAAGAGAIPGRSEADVGG